MKKFDVLIKWIINQTKLCNLILYSWLWWYLWLMFICPTIKGYQVLTKNDIINAIVIAFILFVALNAAAYKGPFKEYVKSFKIFRFWLIPFCVSTVSVACSKVGQTKCRYFFPYSTSSLMIQVFIIIGIIAGGSFINFFLMTSCIDKNEEISRNLKFQTNSNNINNIQEITSI